MGVRWRDGDVPKSLVACNKACSMGLVPSEWRVDLEATVSWAPTGSPTGVIDRHRSRPPPASPR